MKIDKIQSNVMDLQEWIGPELKIKFETMEDYLNFLNITGLKAGYFEPMHLINLKSRHELSKAKDPRAAIFVRIANGLKERGYKGELHLYSKVEEIAKSLWGKNSERGYLNMYLPNMIGIWNSNMVKKDPATIQSAIEIAMDELVDYKIFHDFKDFNWDVNYPVELLHYPISHLYLSLSGRVRRVKDSKFSIKLFEINTFGSPAIHAEKLDIRLKMLPSYAAESFYRYEISTIKDGFKYSVDGSILKEFGTSEQVITLRSDKIAIDQNNRHLNRSRYFKFHSYDEYDEIAKKIIEIQEKIELYFKSLAPNIFADDY